MDNQNKNNQSPKKNNNKQGFSFVILVTLITTILVGALYQFEGKGADSEITYNKFLEYVDRGRVDKVEIQSDKLIITMKKEKGPKSIIQVS